jgi:hypothetical protein
LNASGKWPGIADPQSQELHHRQVTAGSAIDEIAITNQEGARNTMIGDRRSRSTNTVPEIIVIIRGNDPGTTIVGTTRSATATTTTATSGIEEVSPLVVSNAMIFMNDMFMMQLMMSRVSNTR